MEQDKGANVMHVVFDVEDERNMMLPYIYLEFIVRWGDKHDYDLCCAVGMIGHVVCAQVDNCPDGLADALQHLSLYITDSDAVRIFLSTGIKYDIEDPDILQQLLDELLGDDEEEGEEDD